MIHTHNPEEIFKGLTALAMTSTYISSISEGVIRFIDNISWLIVDHHLFEQACIVSRLMTSGFDCIL
jgi:hypothetical protein